MHASGSHTHIHTHTTRCTVSSFRCHKLRYYLARVHDSHRYINAYCIKYVLSCVSKSKLIKLIHFTVCDNSTKFSKYAWNLNIVGVENHNFCVATVATKCGHENAVLCFGLIKCLTNEQQHGRMHLNFATPWGFETHGLSLQCEANFTCRLWLKLHRMLTNKHERITNEGKRNAQQEINSNLVLINAKKLTVQTTGNAFSLAGSVEWSRPSSITAVYTKPQPIAVILLSFGLDNLIVLWRKK